ncbi:MAG: cadherin-like beta sandwich domain-containing protein [Eubacteriales bacterium]|nr:cadherin-like beta sandwich domain-containing protein [Eubacteriales bacterium]
MTKKNNGLKKTAALLIAVFALLYIFPINVYAATKIDSHVTDPTVSAGKTFQITYWVNSTGYDFCGLDGKVVYDTSKLTFRSASAVNGFSMESKETTKGTVNISVSKASGISNGNYMVLTFSASSSFTSGSTSVSLNPTSGTVMEGGSVKDVSASEIRSGSSTVTAQTSTPSTPSTTDPEPVKKSTDSTLKSLSIAEGQLSPAFSSNNTDYSASVPFDTASLTIDAKTNHSNAKYSVSEYTLKEGRSSDVVITVTAEDGIAMTAYTVKVTVEKGPNYVPSANAYLSELSCSQGTLYPAFDKNTFRYTVRVPSDCESFAVSAFPDEPEVAVCTVSGGDVLVIGDNLVTVACTAEDETTTNIYEINVIREGSPDYFASNSYINELSRRIRANESPVVMDMRNTSAVLVPGDILTAIAGKNGMILNVLTDRGSVSFKGEDITGEISEKLYDITINRASHNSNDIKSKFASYETDVIRINFPGKLPGKAEFTVATEFAPGTRVNVYIFDETDGSFLLAARNKKVGQGGTVSFVTDKGGEYVITTYNMKDAKDADIIKFNRSSSRFELSGGRLYIAFAVCALIFTACGFIIGKITGKSKEDDWSEEFGDVEEYDDNDVDNTPERPSGDADPEPETDAQETSDENEAFSKEEDDDDRPFANSEKMDEPEDNDVIDEYENDDRKADKKPKGIFRFRRNNSRNIFGDSGDDKKFEEMLDDLAKYRKDKTDKEQ